MTWSPRESLFFEGHAYFDALIESIGRSKRFVDLETYSFAMDGTGHRVLNALERAACRGVRVRLLVDGFGSWKSILSLNRRLVSTPVQLRVYHPIRLDQSLSRRNHRKTCVVDGKIAWIGSFNIGEDPSRGSRSHSYWRDTAIRIENNGFPELSEAFDRAWGGGMSRFHDGGSLAASQKHFLLNSTLALRRKRNRVLAQRVRRARSRIWVTTPYFSPGRSLARALRAAASRGLDVRLLLPEKPDVPGMRWINSIFYRHLFRSGVKVYLYRPQVLHAKTILIDEWATVGSSNLNHRSWIHDLEVDAIVNVKRSIRELERQFERDLRMSKRVDEEDLGADSSWRRTLDNLGFWVRHWT